VNVHIVVFWAVTLLRLVSGHQTFRKIYYLLLQGISHLYPKSGDSMFPTECLYAPTSLHIVIVQKIKMCLGIPGTLLRPNLDGCFRTFVQQRCSAYWVLILFSPDSCISVLLRTPNCMIKWYIRETSEGFPAWVWWRGMSGLGRTVWWGSSMTHRTEGAQQKQWLL
jgi:hypothetical protein